MLLELYRKDLSKDLRGLGGCGVAQQTRIMATKFWHPRYDVLSFFLRGYSSKLLDSKAFFFDVQADFFLNCKSHLVPFFHTALQISRILGRKNFRGVVGAGFEH